MPSERQTFIKVDDHMPDHPKVAGLSDRAFRVWVTALCYCSRYRTDGVIPAAVWRKMSRGKSGEELAKAGLIRVEDDAASLHDYLDYQRSREHIEELSAKRSAAGHKGGRPPGKGRKPRQTRKQNASGLPSNEEANQNPEVRGSTTYSPDRESPSDSPDRGSATTSPPADAGSAPEPLTESQRAQTLTRELMERRPMLNFPAAMGVIKRAVKAGHADDDIRRALAALVADNRTLTVESLRVQLDGGPTAATPRAPKPSSTDAALAQARALRIATPEPAAVSAPSRRLDRTDQPSLPAGGF